MLSPFISWNVNPTENMCSVSFSICYWPFCFTSTLISSVGIFAHRDKLTHALKPLETHRRWSVKHPSLLTTPWAGYFRWCRSFGRETDACVHLSPASCWFVQACFSSVFLFFHVSSPFCSCIKAGLWKKRTIKTEFYPC